MQNLQFVAFLKACYLEQSRRSTGKSTPRPRESLLYTRQGMLKIIKIICSTVYKTFYITNPSKIYASEAIKYVLV